MKNIGKVFVEKLKLTEQISEIESRNQFYVGIPKQFQSIIADWAVCKKSPYSQSYYNCEGKTWDFTPEYCLRISDHWNFYSRGVKHCNTNIPVETGLWTIAKYVSGEWVVIESYETNKDLELLNDTQYKLSKVNTKLEKYEKKQKADSIIGLMGSLVKREYKKKRGIFKLVSETTYVGKIIKKTDCMLTIQTESGDVYTSKDYKINY